MSVVSVFIGAPALQTGDRTNQGLSKWDRYLVGVSELDVLFQSVPTISSETCLTMINNGETMLNND